MGRVYDLDDLFLRLMPTKSWSIVVVVFLPGYPDKVRPFFSTFDQDGLDLPNAW
jgi:hypothetical protein